MAGQLRRWPGEWALIVEGGSDMTLAHRIKRGWTPCWGPAGSYEAVTRFVGGRLCVWARYVGGGR